MAGPWLGEFGWELMCWQALVRKKAEAYDVTTVCAPRGHEVLYADFAQQFIPHDIRSGTSVMWRRENVDPGERAKLNEKLDALGGRRFLPQQRNVSVGEQKFISYRKDCGLVYDLLIHARNRSHEPHRQWSAVQWDDFVEALTPLKLRIAAIGTEAFCPKGAENLLHRPLANVLETISMAKLIMGPPSGPLHLAALCETPSFVWTRSGVDRCFRWTNRQRFEEVWNPLKTPVTVLETNEWNPDVEVAVRVIQELITRPAISSG